MQRKNTKNSQSYQLVMTSDEINAFFVPQFPLFNPPPNENGTYPRAVHHKLLVRADTGAIILPHVPIFPYTIGTKCAGYYIIEENVPVQILMKEHRNTLIRELTGQSITEIDTSSIDVSFPRQDDVKNSAHTSSNPYVIAQGKNRFARLDDEIEIRAYKRCQNRNLLEYRFITKEGHIVPIAKRSTLELRDGLFPSANKDGVAYLQNKAKQKQRRKNAEKSNLRELPQINAPVFPHLNSLTFVTGEKGENEFSTHRFFKPQLSKNTIVDELPIQHSNKRKLSSEVKEELEKIGSIRKNKKM